MFGLEITGGDTDLWLLVAVILFAVATVLSVSDRAWTAVCGYAGLTFFALGILVT